MKRRTFLRSSAAAAASLTAVWPRTLPAFADREQAAQVVTVTGEVAADQLGKMLPHEHILVDFVGADQVSPDRYDADEVFQVMLPYVKQAKDAGCPAIAGHTGDGKAALEQVAILRKEGVSPSAWIWVHAQNERNPAVHLQVARAGAWVEFDGVGPSSIDRHVELVKTLQQAGLLDHVLFSHDAGWYSVGEPRGGKVRGFDTLFTAFLPALKKAGLSEAEIKHVIVTNPANAFTIRVRER